MASAAGGTSQRLNPGLAMVRSRERKEGVAGMGRTSVVDIMTSALRGGACRPAAKGHSLAKTNLERIPRLRSQTFPGRRVAFRHASSKGIAARASFRVTHTAFARARRMG